MSRRPQSLAQVHVPGQFICLTVGIHRPSFSLSQSTNELDTQRRKHIPRSTRPLLAEEATSRRIKLDAIRRRTTPPKHLALAIVAIEDHAESAGGVVNPLPGLK